MSDIHQVIFYPVGNGDTTQIILSLGRRVLLGFCHRDYAEDDDTPDINLKARLKDIEVGQSRLLRCRRIHTCGSGSHSRQHRFLRAPARNEISGRRPHQDSRAVGSGGIWVIAPSGAVVGIVRMPGVIRNLAFGGPDFRTLYLTASKCLRTAVIRRYVDKERNRLAIRSADNSPHGMCTAAVHAESATAQE